jgi:hypothetical protein
VANDGQWTVWYDRYKVGKCVDTVLEEVKGFNRDAIIVFWTLMPPNLCQPFK